MGAAKERAAGRMEELVTGNTALCMDPLTVALSRHFPKVCECIGLYYEEELPVRTEETAIEGFGILLNEFTGCFKQARDEAIGARAEAYSLLCFIYPSIVRPSAESERTAEMCHTYFAKEWGDYGSAFIEACKAYQHARHYQIVSGGL